MKAVIYAEGGNESLPTREMNSFLRVDETFFVRARREDVWCERLAKPSRSCTAIEKVVPALSLYFTARSDQAL